MHTMTPTEMVEAMVRSGVPREKAEAFVTKSPSAGPGLVVDDLSFRTTGIAVPGKHLEDRRVDPVALPLVLPFRLTLPWSALCSDNEHEVAALRMHLGKPVPFRKMSAHYRAAKEAIHSRAKVAVQGAAPRTEPLAILVRVFVPSRQHSNDHINFSKVVHDALQGIVYANDRQLHDVHWVRAGIDVDRPRAEIVISALRD